MTISSYYYPISYLPTYPYNTEPITFNSDYINNLISLGVTDYFSPTQFVTNPLFANVDSFNQNVGLLQTATDSLNKVLTLIDDLKNINNPTQDVINEFENEINNILNNTTYNDLNVFDQTLNIDGENINLDVPLYNPDTYTIEEYEKVISDKYNSLYSTLQNLTFTLPTQTSFNPYSIYIPTETYQSFDYSTITPQTLELLLL